jgi:putative flippase GtrA
MKERLARIPWQSIGRWWIVGLGFTAGGLGVLYLLKDVLHWPLWVGTAIGSEVIMLLRFLANDRWVFGHRRPSWKRLWQFHVASAGGSLIWWVVANVLPRFGVYYLIAALAGTGCSVLFSMATNFLWIWSGHGRTAVPAPAAAGTKDIGSIYAD